MEVPFSEAEKRFVLAEAIKTSSVPIERLLAVLSEGQVVPSWTEMLLPHGRNLKSCIDAFDALRSSSFSSSSLPASFPTPTTAPGSSNKRKPAPENLESSSASPAQKRRQSGTDTIATARIIQPKPSSNGSPQSFSPLAAGQQPKKRGRPSKADVEARNAEAIARGEVIPPSRAQGPRNSQMTGVGQFDARSPVPRELVPSPRMLAPSLPIGGDVSMSFPTKVTGPVGAISPMIAMDPASPKVDSAETTASGKKKRVRPGSKQTKVPKAGESSFQAVDPRIGQVQPATEPSAEQPPMQQNPGPISFRSELEKQPPVATQTPQAEAPPASSPRLDIL